MLDTKFWQKVFTDQASNDSSRRKIIGESAGALHLAKQTIFSLQRDNVKEAEEKFKASSDALISLEKRFGGNGKLRGEGSWKAAVEEFVEAKLFFDFYRGQKVGGIKEIYVEPNEYIGGLSDLTGEMLRMMVLWTSRGKIEKVKETGKAIEEVIHDLLQNNLSGYLRTKFDQAKKNLQRAESILYDLSIRDK